MSKFSRQQIKDHNIAVELLQKDKLTFEEKLIVFEKWNEGATSVNSEAGAFFTPYELANDFSLNIYDKAKTPFKYSGAQFFMDLRKQNKGYNPYGLSVPSKVQKFIKQSGLDYQFNIGIDTSIYLDRWKGVSPLCEIVCFEFKV